MSNSSSSKSTITPIKPTIPTNGRTVLCGASESPCNRISRPATVWVTDESIAECWDAVLPSNSLTNALVWMKNTPIVKEDEACANGWMPMCADCFKYWYDDDGDGDGVPASDENVKWWRYNLVVQRVFPIAVPEPAEDPAPASNSSTAPAEPAVQPKRMLVASYTSETLFDIPKGIDLEAPGWTYTVKRDVLYISGPAGQELEVQPRYSATECADFKYPDDTHLVAEEDGYDAPDDEEED